MVLAVAAKMVDELVNVSFNWTTPFCEVVAFTPLKLNVLEEEAPPVKPLVVVIVIPEVGVKPFILSFNVFTVLAVAAKVVEEFARLSKLSPPRPQPLLESLSPRELEVLRLVATGATNREIAARLYITEGTVKNHVTDILSKLNVTDRTQAALKARDLGIL